MSVKISVAKIVMSPFQLRRSVRNYNPKSKRNLKQFAPIPKSPAGEISQRRKFVLKDLLFNYICAYNHHIRNKKNTNKPFNLESVTITFPHLVYDEDEAKSCLDKWKRKMNKNQRRRFCIVTERGEAGGIHFHAIGEFCAQDFAEWKNIVDSNSPFLIHSRNLNIFKRNGTFRRSWKSEVRKAINYLLKGTVQNQGFISGRLYYISKSLRSFEARKLTGKRAVKWIQKNIMYLTKIGEGEFFEIYSLTKYFENRIIGEYRHILSLQINSP